jgi:hypothetical protein
MDKMILEAALIGYQSELERVTGAMKAIREHLGGGGLPGPFERTAPEKKWRWRFLRCR